MRKTGLVSALIVLLAQGLLIAAGPAEVAGIWEGPRSSTVKVSGGPKLRSYLSSTLELDSVRTWTLEDPLGNVVTGAWSRPANSQKKLYFELDDQGRDGLARLIVTDLAEDIPDPIVKILSVKTKGKAKSSKTRGDSLIVKLKVKFAVVVDGTGKSGTWKGKVTVARDDTPTPKPGVELVTQSQFRELGSAMIYGRSSHTMDTLSDGRVLVVGGYASGNSVLSSVESFDPKTERFSLMNAKLNVARGAHTSTKLQDGRILIVGGERIGDPRSLNSAEVYMGGAFQTTNPMSAERTSHTSTRLPNGKVLVTGGRTANGLGQTLFHKTAEIWDPSSGAWSPTANDMEMLRAGHRATLMSNGLVLITGGSGNLVAEIFDPATRSFRTLNSRMVAIRSLHGAVEVLNNVVFLTDGGARQGEMFDLRTETFFATSNTDSQIRSTAITFQFAPGEVLIMGGMDFQAGFLHGTMEQFSQTYSAGGSYFHLPALPGTGVYLRDPRAFSAFAKLHDGRYLVTGGLGESFDSSDLDSAVLFTPK